MGALLSYQNTITWVSCTLELSTFTNRRVSVNSHWAAKSIFSCTWSSDRISHYHWLNRHYHVIINIGSLLMSRLALNVSFTYRLVFLSQSKRYLWEMSNTWFYLLLWLCIQELSRIPNKVPLLGKIIILFKLEVLWKFSFLFQRYFNIVSLTLRSFMYCHLIIPICESVVMFTADLSPNGLWAGHDKSLPHLFPSPSTHEQIRVQPSNHPSHYPPCNNSPPQCRPVLSLYPKVLSVIKIKNNQK